MRLKIIHLLVDYLLRRVYVLREEMDEFEDECLADAGKPTWADCC